MRCNMYTVCVYTPSTFKRYGTVCMTAAAEEM